MLKIDRKILISLFALYIAVALIHVLVTRPAYITWGATLPELTLHLPGDTEIPTNSVVSTRAITIHAPPSKIWPWIVQIGQDRAGWYSFDWLENLFAANMHNANSVVAAWQTLYIGDHLPFLEGGTDDTFSAKVTDIESEHSLVMEGWTLDLVPIDAQTTHLVVRYPGVDAAGTGAFYYYPIFEPAHFIMETGMMLGIKDRAEGT